MANKDKANGFKPVGRNPIANPYPLTASETIAIGDLVYLTGTSGRVSIMGATTAKSCGAAATSCTSSTVDDIIYVYDDPEQKFEAQCSGTGAVGDIETCDTTTDCFDIEATTGAMEINEDASTYDIIQVVGIGSDPETGKKSAAGANQRKICKINPAKHQLGCLT